MADLPAFLTPDEAAAELRISRDKMRELIESGVIQIVVLGPRTRRIPREAIDALIARQTNLYQAEPVA